MGLGLVHHHHGAGAVGDLRGRSGGDGAVLAESGLQARQRVRGGVGADALVLVELDWVALALRNSNGHNFIGEDTVFPCGRGLLVGGSGELVLLLAGELVGVVALLGERPIGWSVKTSCKPSYAMWSLTVMSPYL